jgi:hypothetical protein
MSETMATLKLDFPEAIEIQLTNKALKFVMSKEFWHYFSLHFGNV